MAKQQNGATKNPGQAARKGSDFATSKSAGKSAQTSTMTPGGTAPTQQGKAGKAAKKA